MTSNSIGTSLEKQLNIDIIKNIEAFLPSLKEVYLDEYTENLSTVVIDKASLANPEYFYDDYSQALDSFSYILQEDDDLIIKIPTEDTFSFKGRLSFIKLLVHGIVGKYLELPQVDYDYLKSNKSIDNRVKRAIRGFPSFYDNNTPKELRFYLVHTRNSLYKSIEGILEKKLVEFPFSNSPPLYIFDGGVKFFEANIDKLLNTGIDDSIEVIKRSV